MEYVLVPSLAQVYFAVAAVVDGPPLTSSLVR